MKKLLLLIPIVFTSLVYGQVPNQINYQAVARNSVGNVLPNKRITVRISIREGSGDGTTLYSETRKITTNSFGLFNMAIGSPGVESYTGNMNTIDWGSTAKFIKVEIDPDGRSIFADMGSAQLLSVPYALYSGKSGSVTPNGPAGGVLTGTYPNPSIADGAITQTMITNGAITTNKLADNSVTTTKIADASVTSAKLAAGVIPTSLPPSGSAGGDLTGTYPNPTINNGAITTAKIADASVTSAKLATGVIPTSLPPSGSAGGDLTGTYPNPTINNGIITTAKLADNSITTAKIVDASVTSAKLASGVIPTSLPPSGTAGGDLNGSYPNPSVNKLQGVNITATGAIVGQILKFDGTGWVPGTDNSGSGGSPSGPAGGDLTGTYPNPTIINGAITTTKLADNSVTTLKIVDASVTSTKLAAGVIPTTLPPSGSAGGDLSGNYPNPLVNKLQGISVSNTIPGAGQVLKFDGTQWIAGTDNTGSGGSPSGPAGGDLSGTYPNPSVSAGAITTPKISNGAVITPKLADDAVTTNKLADLAVTTAKIADASVTTSKLAAGVIPTSLPPSGSAGGDLIGTYPNPSVNKILGVNVTTTGAITGQVLKFDGTSWVPGTDNSGSGGSPSGPAGGDLTGTYPNPTINNGVITTTKLADNSVTTSKIVDASVTSAKLAAGVIPTSLPPSGSAGGDLNGTYPNPILNKIQGVNVTATGATAGQILKFDGTSWVPGTDNSGSGGSPSGSAGGDLTGTYPNPTINNGVITTTKLADNSVSTTKIIDASVTSAKLAAGVIPTSLPPNGVAGGDLTGTFPNPSVNKILGVNVTTTGATSGQVLKFDGTSWVPGTDNTGSGGSPTGPAGGDLTGTYPNPTINTGVITTTKLADNSVTTAKIVDASVTSAKLAVGVIPTSLPPNGAAGGDLSGSYPNPSVNKIQGISVSNTGLAAGLVLKYDGTQWAPSADNTGSLSLPYSSSNSSASNLFSLTNTGTGAALEGINSTTTANVSGILGKITSTTPGAMAAAIKGLNSGTGTNGIGVYGTHSGNGWGVYGSTSGGTGVYGNAGSGFGLVGTSTSGTGIFAESSTGTSAMFTISNTSNSNDVVSITNSGLGRGISAWSEYNNGIEAISNDGPAGVMGFNNTSGTGVWGVTFGNAGAGIKGTSTAEGGTAVEGELLNITTGNVAVFKVDGTNVARINHTGRGFFNGGTQNSGADVAEAFDVEGNRKAYEPGDVLIISQSSDRRVEKSNTAYSTLVAGVYATQPGVLLTEKNALQDQIDEMIPMGVIGVIPTKVCLEGGNIKRGDLLVTSSIPGVAMKADPDKVKVGQVLGKALEDYSVNSIGKIKVLVSIK